MLVFFGFTHRPDICPVTSAGLSEAMTLLGADADKVVPVFITVDPERDTPEVMKAYLANFDARFVGLTGTPEQIKSVTEAYKAYYAKHEAPQAFLEHGGHGDHGQLRRRSFGLYLPDEPGRHIYFAFPYNAAAPELVDAVRKQVNG